MKLPKSFVLHGHTIKVREVDKLKSNNFGHYDDAREEIVIAHKLEDADGELVTLSPEQIEHTFYHELFHVFQWHAKGETNESEAQSYAGLMLEFIKTSGIKINPNVVHDPINETYNEI